MSAATAASEESIVIYHIEGRRSFRIVWLCEELGLPYRLVFKPGDVFGSMMLLRKDHPLMPITPAVVLRGEIIVESGAILDVLTARYGRGRLVPDVESSDYPRHAQWLHFAEATFLSRCVTNRMASLAMNLTPHQLPVGYRSGMEQAPPQSIGPLTFFEMTVGPLGLFDFMDEYLSRFPYFGGNIFTTADIMMHYAIRGAKLSVWIDPKNYEHISRWKHAVEARAAFIRATAAATPSGADEYGLPQGQPLPFPPPPA